MRLQRTTMSLDFSSQQVVDYLILVKALANGPSLVHGASAVAKRVQALLVPPSSLSPRHFPTSPASSNQHTHARDGSLCRSAKPVATSQATNTFLSAEPSGSRVERPKQSQQQHNVFSHALKASSIRQARSRRRERMGVPARHVLERRGGSRAVPVRARVVVGVRAL